MVAFSGAQGFGANTIGGAGGRIIQVTNLNDSGPGSFREAVKTNEPRIITFPNLSGTITLLSPVKAESPFVSILGGTSPRGITLRADPSYPNECLGIETEDFIVRHLRIRPGPSAMPSVSRRAMLLRYGVKKGIIDHCSLSWSTDEILTIIDGVEDVTVQWSILSEPLHRSTHKDGAHSKALSISGKGAWVGRISVHHNLFAHSMDRNPNPACQGLVDIVNNIIYNYGDRATNVSDLQAKVPVNYQRNHVKRGPNSNKARYEIMLTETGTNNNMALWVKDNYGPHRSLYTEDELLVVDPLDRKFVVPTRHPAPSVSIKTFDQVLAGVGAFPRDRIDERIINEVLTGTGKVIDNPLQVGGWI